MTTFHSDDLGEDVRCAMSIILDYVKKGMNIGRDAVLVTAASLPHGVGTEWRSSIIPRSEVDVVTGGLLPIPIGHVAAIFIDEKRSCRVIAFDPATVHFVDAEAESACKRISAPGGTA